MSPSTRQAAFIVSNRWDTSSNSKIKKLIYKSRDSVKLPGWNLKEKGIRMRAGTHLSITFPHTTPPPSGQTPAKISLDD